MHSTSAPPDAIAALRDILDRSPCIAIVSHFNPDGDALGSSLGLAHVLRAKGHHVQVVMPNAAPPNLHWMPGHAAVITHEHSPAEAAAAIREADVLFCLDFNRSDRVGRLEEDLKAARVRVLIDHHQEPEHMAAVSFSDTTACATCQMVYDVVVALGAADALDRDAATCLYAGIVTDSGSFRFRSTSPHTMRVAADLMERGVAVDAVHSAIMDSNTEGRLRLLGFTLAERMEVLQPDGVALLWLERADLERHGFVPGDTEGFVNYGLSIKGVRLSAFLMERPDGVKLSLRSRGQLPVDRLLKEHFQGGGHTNAAGGRFDGPMPQAMEKLRGLLPSFLASHPAA